MENKYLKQIIQDYIEIKQLYKQELIDKTEQILLNLENITYYTNKIIEKRIIGKKIKYKINKARKVPVFYKYRICNRGKWLIDLIFD